MNDTTTDDKAVPPERTPIASCTAGSRVQWSGELGATRFGMLAAQLARGVAAGATGAVVRHLLGIELDGND